MASQIDELRASFNKMNTEQKKQFIDKLKQKLKGNNNAEYAKLLNECIQKYNTESRSGSSRNNFGDLFDDDLPTSDYIIAKPPDRLLAYLIDSVVAFAVFFGIGLILGVLGGILAGVTGEYIFVTMATILTYIIGGLVYFLIFCLNYWKRSTSFGKERMKLTVVDKETGEKLSFGYMFLREIFGKWISGMIFSLGFIWILLDKDKQGWHDKLVSSVVVKR